VFYTDKENSLSDKYLNNGYIIESAANNENLTWIRKKFVEISKEELDITNNLKDEDFLNSMHKFIPVQDLNNFRLKVFNKINKISEFRQKYYQIAKPYLDAIVGSELSMQININLSIQLPGDNSSLLPTHADTWSGDSPFEVVVWIPLVNCYKTKSMYILPPKEDIKLNHQFGEMAGSHSEDLYSAIKNKVNWINIDYGNILLFNNALPHGNRVNLECETRWSMNCRFKGVFTPYWDKKLGSFFEPITLKAASIAGMNYKLPELK
jgi:sporadic carbohydrate cluster 2OG-Fe(II) oxygenase